MLFCPDDDEEGSLTIGNLLALAAAGGNDTDTFTSFCSMPRDKRVDLIVSDPDPSSEGLRGRQRQLMETIETRVANAKVPEQGRMLGWNRVKNYGWCSMDIRFILKVRCPPTPPDRATPPAPRRS